MTKQIVLKLLREHTEEFLSGEAISRQAGVSPGGGVEGCGAVKARGLRY